jgi:hypothetical protein
MKKTAIIYVFVLALVTFGQAAWAQNYITDLMLVGEPSQSDASDRYDSFVSQGWTGINHNLNSGTDGYYIYLLYKTTDYESRFKLVFASVCEDADGDNETFAFNSNGNWIIGNEGEATLQLVDINGRILSSETINGSVSKAIDVAPRVYILKLNDKVQKIIIR